VSSVDYLSVLDILSKSHELQRKRESEITKSIEIKCPLCSNSAINFSLARAIISPWIRNLAGVKKRTSKFFFCEVCSGAFFDYRYSPLEMARLYQNYRDENYVKLRRKWEPWYTKDFNDAHNTDYFVGKRKIALQNFLLSLEISNFETIVDVGGDFGQFIPDLGVNNNKYVLDLSEQPLIPGIRRINSLQELKEIDLIIYAHVLEHVDSPLTELKKLTDNSRFVYVEVPEGIPEINKIRKSKILYLFNLATSFEPRLWGRFSKPSGGRIMKSKFLRQSEHINFFNEQTFTEMAITLDLSMISLSTTSIPSPEGGEAKVIRAVYSKK
jgi:hypothetical protein